VSYSKQILVGVAAGVVAGLVLGDLGIGFEGAAFGDCGNGAPARGLVEIFREQVAHDGIA